MAAVEPIAFGDPLDCDQWLVVRGTLREVDFATLLDGISSSPACNVTLDLLNLQHLTRGGCWTIRSLADELWRQGCVLTVLFPNEGSVAELLRATGTTQHQRAMFLTPQGG